MSERIDYLELAARIAAADVDKLNEAMWEIKATAETLTRIGRDKVSSAGADEKSSENKNCVVDRIETPREPEAGKLAGINKFLQVAPDVRLVRFTGAESVKLVGRRPARCGNPACRFEIEVNREGKTAYIRRDDDEICAIIGDRANVSLVEKMAISALHQYLKSTRQANMRSKRRKKRIRAAKRAAEAAKEVVG